MASLCLAVLAPSATETNRAIINHAITVAISCSGDKWQLVPPAKANLVLVWINSDKDKKALDILQNKYHAERVIALTSNEFRVEARWHLSFQKNKIVPNILSIINLFNRIQAYFFPDFETDTPPTFNPYEYLPGIIQHALNDAISRICTYEPCPELYLLPKENSFYFSGHIEELIPMALARSQDIKITEVADQKILETVNYVKFSSRLSSYINIDEDDTFENIKIKKYKRYSINELIWFSVLINSRGRLIDNASPKKTVLLKQAPEYMRLDYYANEYKNLADCMANDALNLFEISDKLKKPLVDLVGFYNACSMLNLIEHGETAKQIKQKKTESRNELKNVFGKVADITKGRIKIVVAGSVGSGKTTAISVLSDFTPIRTESRASDTVTRKKSTTTVAMDYGEIRFNNELKVFLYGTPGQKRFDFMSQILCENAWGMLLLIDNTDNDPLAELGYYLDLFGKFLQQIHLSIGITHSDLAEKPVLKEYRDFLLKRDLPYPVMQVDARDTSSLVNLLANLVDYGLLNKTMLAQ